MRSSGMRVGAAAGLTRRAPPPGLRWPDVARLEPIIAGHRLDALIGGAEEQAPHRRPELPWAGTRHPDPVRGGAHRVASEGHVAAAAYPGDTLAAGARRTLSRLGLKSVTEVPRRILVPPAPAAA